MWRRVCHFGSPPVGANLGAMLNRHASLAMAGGFLSLMGAIGACDGETTATTSNPSATTGTQSGGGGAGADGGGSVGGSGGAGAAGGGGGVTNMTNANCEAPTGTPGNLTTVEVANGFTFPVAVTYAYGDGDRLYVVEKGGKIQLVQDGVVTEFLDIAGRFTSGGFNSEQGLLGLAFHPDYANNGRFFVHYSNGAGGPGVGNGDTVIEEYRRDPSNPDLADSTPVQLVYTTNQPFGNHNGGTIAFSPADGYLWIGLGDGGSGGDPDGNGQDKSTPLGALLRLDVDSAQPYAVPAGNITDGLAEIYDWGLRNPYRWSFDVCTGDRYIGDVGQGCYEEIDVAASNAGNLNWGWNTMEANHCYAGTNCDQTPPGDCDATGMELPVHEIPRTQANSITGGHVYRGSAIPWLRGMYFYADFAQGNAWMLRWVGGTVTEGPTDITAQIGVPTPSGFGIDNDGELYVLSYGDFPDGANAALYRIAEQ